MGCPRSAKVRLTAREMVEGLRKLAERKKAQSNPLRA